MRAGLGLGGLGLAGAPFGLVGLGAGSGSGGSSTGSGAGGAFSRSAFTVNDLRHSRLGHRTVFPFRSAGRFERVPQCGH